MCSHSQYNFTLQADDTGYYQLANGLILQFGTSISDHYSFASDISVTFPKAFPHKCLQVLLTPDSSYTGWDSTGVLGNVHSLTQQGFRWSSDYRTIHWLAIGY